MFSGVGSIVTQFVLLVSNSCCTDFFPLWLRILEIAGTKLLLYIPNRGSVLPSICGTVIVFWASFWMKAFISRFANVGVINGISDATISTALWVAWLRAECIPPNGPECFMMSSCIDAGIP